MAYLLRRTWHPDSKMLTKKVDRWMSRRRPRAEVGEESDWLGWDGWVRATDNTRATLDSTNDA